MSKRISLILWIGQSPLWGYTLMDGLKERDWFWLILSFLWLLAASIVIANRIYSKGE